MSPINLLIVEYYGLLLLLERIAVILAFVLVAAYYGRELYLNSRCKAGKKQNGDRTPSLSDLLQPGVVFKVLDPDDSTVDYRLLCVKQYDGTCGKFKCHACMTVLSNGEVNIEVSDPELAQVFYRKAEKFMAIYLRHLVYSISFQSSVDLLVSPDEISLFGKQLNRAGYDAYFFSTDSCEGRDKYILLGELERNSKFPENI